MAFDFTQHLVIGVSSRALFDLELENSIFEKEGLESYSTYQIEHEDEALKPGVAFPLVKGILTLNSLAPGKRKTEVIVMSRNSADTSLRIWKSIEALGLDITRGAFTSGTMIPDYLKAFDVDLFLSANSEAVQAAIAAGFAAARVLDPPEQHHEVADQIRIAFDGDAVLFSEESERIYEDQGLETFIENERQNAKKPMSEGPFAKLLKTLSFLQKDLEDDLAVPPIRTALVTSRGSPAHERVIRTLRAWGVRIDEAFFLDGAAKDQILQAFEPHIFFDDSHRHVKPASLVVPVAQVPTQIGFDEGGVTPKVEPLKAHRSRRRQRKTG